MEPRAGERKIPWLVLTGWAFLIHVILIALSFAEVFLYASLFEPGHEPAFYEQHAQQSAPIISIVFGILFFLVFARKLARKRPGIKLKVGLWLAVIYIVIDLLILAVAGTGPSANLWIVGVSFLTKLGASLTGAMSVKNG